MAKARLAPKKIAGHKVVSTYLSPVYHPDKYALLIATLAKAIRGSKVKYDAIAFMGTSGAAAAYPLGLRLRKPLMCVRKEGAHCRLRVEGLYNASAYIIVDDLISSGATIHKIQSEIESVHDIYQVKPKCVHIFLYADLSARFRPVFEGIPITYTKEIPE